MEKLKKCAGCRYCRVHTAIKTSIVFPEEAQGEEKLQGLALRDLPAER